MYNFPKLYEENSRCKDILSEPKTHILYSDRAYHSNLQTKILMAVNVKLIDIHYL